MKTRIISGLTVFGLLIGLLALNFFYPITVIIAAALLSPVAVFEMLSRTGAVKLKLPVIVAMLYVAALQFSLNGFFIDATALTVAFVVITAVLAVVCHKKFDVSQVVMTIAMPIVLGFAFSALVTLVNAEKIGLLYFVLLFNFACVTDIGAYFVGSMLGKHKLAPEISPKKTIEGAVGGAVLAVICTIGICLVFQAILGKPINIVLLAAVTPVFSIIGMFGDLFASVIKRHFGIKDYGNIMPGHGGVLDRTDSILLIAPALALFFNNVSVI